MGLKYFDLGALVGFEFHLGLADFKRDVFRRVIGNPAAIAEAIDEVFRAKVVRVEESNPPACNADMKARCVATFSALLCHGFMANRRFRLGTLCLTTSNIFGEFKAGHSHFSLATK